MDCRESVDIYVSATGLQRMDLLSKSDPFAKLYYMGPSTTGSNQQPLISDTFTCLGNTETIQNNLNPSFAKSFSLYYYFEYSQKLKVEIYDDDGGSSHQLMGRTEEFTLSQVVCSRDSKFKVDLVNNSKVVGQVFLYAEKVVRQSDANLKFSAERERLAFQNFSTLSYKALRDIVSEIPKTVPTDVKFVGFTCCAKNLDKKDLFGKSDPYFFFEKEVASRREKLYQSEVISKNLNPDWSYFSLNLNVFNNDLNRIIHVKCFDHDKNSDDDLIGECSFSLDEVIHQGKKQFDLIEPTLATKKKNYKNSGIFEFKLCEILTKQEPIENPELSIYNQVLSQKENRYTEFLDYVFGGCSISVSVGIDFTGSNRQYTETSSLHHLGNKPNQYQQALTQVMSILEPYDVDKMYGAYGYGATIDSKGMQPMFNLSLTDKEELHGTHEILVAYANALPRLSFGDMGSAINPKTKQRYWGDDFYRLIETVVEKTPKVKQENQVYNILLLVIDGDSFDMQSTINSIIEANDKPLSIIIVGVGNSNFGNCREFDADDKPLVHTNGKKMTRDIVQFVRFEDCSSVEELAKQVLAEIPKQLVTFFESKNILPNPRPIIVQPPYY